MTKNFYGGATINSGPTLPNGAETPNGSLFHKTSAPSGLYFYGFNQDVNSGLFGDQSTQGWTLLADTSGSQASVRLDGDIMLGPLEIPNHLRITQLTGEQRILIGNQDASGANRPSIIMGANGTIQIGTGNTWVGNGGAFTAGLVINPASIMGLSFLGNTVWHAGIDGAGSTLDADLLDGQQGTFYSDLANSTGVLPISRGGTGAISAAAARTTLGATPTGDALFTTSSAAAARATLGAMATGDALFTTSSAAAARATLGAMATGDALITAPSAAAARSMLGSTPVGDFLFTAASAEAARTTLDLAPTQRQIHGSDGTTMVIQQLHGVIDFNNLNSSGVFNFSVGEGVANRPAGGLSWVFLEVYRHNNLTVGSEFVVQVAHEMLSGSGVSRMWVRRRVGPHWTQWQSTTPIASGEAPIFAPRAWVHFNGMNGVISGGGNVSSVTRVNVGDYIVNFGIGMPHTEYALTASASNMVVISLWPVSTSQVRMVAQTLVGTSADPSSVGLAAFA